MCLLGIISATPAISDHFIFVRYVPSFLNIADQSYDNLNGRIRYLSIFTSANMFGKLSCFSVILSTKLWMANNVLFIKGFFMLMIITNSYLVVSSGSRVNKDIR